MIHFSCPTCRKVLGVAPEHAGGRTKCPHCGQALQIPAAGPQASKAPAPEAAAPVPVPAPPVSHGKPGRVGALIGLGAGACVLVLGTMTVTLWASGFFSRAPNGKFVGDNTTPTNPPAPTPPATPAKPAPTDKPKAPPKPVVARPWEPNPDLFRWVQATDGSFSLLVPKDWKVKTANMGAGPDQGLNVWSDKGEMVFQHVIRLDGNVENFKANVQKGVFSREQADWLERFFCQPLSPVEGVRDYFPQLYAPLVQKDVRVLESQEVPAPPAVAGNPGAKAAAVHYTYTLRKSKEAAPAALALFPKALTDQDEVAMEGRVVVVTIPGMQITYLRPWQLTVYGYEAPADLCRKDRLFYETMLRSFRENPQVIGAIVQQNVAAQQAMTKSLLQIGLNTQKQTEGASSPGGIGANAQRRMEATSEFFNYMVGGDTPYYSERERRVYVVPTDQSGGEVVSPTGEVLRPASPEELAQGPPPCGP